MGSIDQLQRPKRRPTWQTRAIVGFEGHISGSNVSTSEAPCH